MGNILFGTVIILACVIPFVLLSFHKKSKDRKMANIFRDMVSAMHLNPGQFEVSGNLILGLNDEASHFFFYKERDGKPENQVVPLQPYVQCVVQKTGGVQGLSAVTSATLQAVSLHFIPRDKGTADMQVKIFDVKKDLQLNDELRIAEKWAQKVQPGLQNK